MRCVRVQGEEREQDGGAHAHPHGGKTLQVRPVQLRRQAEGQSHPAQDSEAPQVQELPPAVLQRFERVRARFQLQSFPGGCRSRILSVLVKNFTRYQIFLSEKHVYCL